MITIAITGASGTMGQEAVPALMKLADVRLRLLMRRTKRGLIFAKRYQKQFGDRIEVLFGDIRSMDDCRTLCDGADYLIHLAAVIPPLADHEAEMTMTTNRDGTQNLVQAVLDAGNKAKFLHISTVAIYGHRTEKHPWGRVGDPLVTSAFDVYGLSKTMAEFSVIESGITNWAVLRQTGVLYDNILMNNISDGLMFHTPWDVPIEWVTALDSAILLANIIRRDMAGEVPAFWKRIYNIGGGEATRITGYETFDNGFRLIGGSIKSFFRPNWNPPRNFHCFWFSDSDELEELFHFRTQSCDTFWAWYLARHRIYSLGRLAPKALIRKLAIERLFKNSNAPAYWLEHGDTARIQAFFGGMGKYNEIPARWEERPLFCESEGYAEAKVYTPEKDLDHGYDESKEDAALELSDMQQAASFRGGSCISKEMKPGDLYTKLSWKCHAGHTFEATPFTVLKAGHWCPDCCQKDYVWQMDLVAAHSPFHAQVWNDSHDPSERFRYTLSGGEAKMEALS